MRKFLAPVLLVFTAAALLAGCKKNTESSLTPVTLNEVAHSIFYAPQYVAIEEGYFADEGIDLTLITGFGADKVLTAMISGEADIGFMGAEATVYAYLEGTADPVVNFAQLTQRAGNFVVGREKDNSFTWEKLKNKEVLGGRKGGMPEMVFEYVLAQKGIDKKDVNINQSIDFGSTAAAFSGGQGDYTIEFEPSATLLEQKGDGYVVASVGTESGYVPYTSYSVKQSYLKTHGATVKIAPCVFTVLYQISIFIYRTNIGVLSYKGRNLISPTFIIEPFRIQKVNVNFTHKKSTCKLQVLSF